MKTLENIFVATKNEELSQATARLVFYTIFYSYLLISIFVFDAKMPPLLFKGIILAFALYAIAHYVWVKKSPDPSIPRRIMAILTDITIVSVGISYLEWASLLIYPLYSWIIVGNGMRFGFPYLIGTMMLSVFEFSLLIVLHPFWMANIKMGIGLLWIIVVLPLFFMVMLKRLQAANQQLQNELRLRQQQEAILIQQSRFAAMGEMIGNIAHQWRQPLNALSLLLQNIVFSYKAGRLDEEMIDHVNEKGFLLTNAMSTTIDDFRNFFKPNKAKEHFFISTQIQTTLSMIEASLATNLITIRTNIDENLQIYGFANEFSQVILNILNNAKDALIEHQSDPRVIHIRGYSCDNAVCIEIADNAGGIPSDVIDKVFDPYFTTKEEGKGTGIGLYMSKVIIEHNMNGRLGVHNDADGAIFSIMLPIVKDSHHVI